MPAFSAIPQVGVSTYLFVGSAGWVDAPYDGVIGAPPQRQSIPRGSNLGPLRLAAIPPGSTVAGRTAPLGSFSKPRSGAVTVLQHCSSLQFPLRVAWCVPDKLTPNWSKSGPLKLGQVAKIWDFRWDT